MLLKLDTTNRLGFLVRNQNKQDLCILFVLCVMYHYCASNKIHMVNVVYLIIKSISRFKIICLG